MAHNWYLTTPEFAALCVSAIEDSGFFKRNDLAHPEDIANAFTTVAPAIAMGVTFGGRNSEKNAAVKIASTYAGTVSADIVEE